MKKVVLSLIAIIMVSMSSVSMASNKGKHHHKGNRTEVIVIHENNRGGNCREYRDRDYRNNDRYYRHDNRRCNDYRDGRRCEVRYKKHKCKGHRCDGYCYEPHHHHHNTNAKVAGAILGTAALVLLTTH